MITMRTYKNDGKGFEELAEGTAITGIFVAVKEQQITDIRTKEKKTIRVYSIRDEEKDELLKVGSRALLDGIFDDIMDEHGGVIVENGRWGGPGIEWIRNRHVIFTRGKNKKSRSGDVMGTYEIMVDDD